MPSALSFHCMICFEEFDNDTVYPVVLPCGHTYVCVLCAGRIDKCMECRASLFAPVQNSDKKDPPLQENNQIRGRSYSSGSSSAARAGRNPGYGYGYSPPPAIPRKKVVPKPKTRLPLPKNVVLMSLIEASQLANLTTNRMQLEPPKQDTEDNKILMSTDLATTSCGTYAVAKKEGLKIVSTMEGRSLKSTRRIFGDDKIVGSSMIGPRKRSSHGFFQTNEVQLNYGDRIQVVTIVDHWAKLARGYGYVYFEDSSDLVRVSGVLDKACNIESMLYILSYQRNHLLNSKTKIEKDALSLMHELQETLNGGQDLTVIGSEAFSSRDIMPEPELRDDKLLYNSASSENQNIYGDGENSSSEDSGLTKPSRTKTPVRKSEPQHNQLIDWFRSFYSSESNDEQRQRQQRDETDSRSMEVSRAMVESASAWRERNGEHESDTIFRTGLSNHLGANGYQGNHTTSSQHYGPSSLPKMSAHGGLTPNRRKKMSSMDKDFLFSKSME